MNSKETKTKFDAAAKTFQAAEAELARLTSRTDEFAQHLLQARLEFSRIDSELDRFAIGTDSAEVVATKAAGLARELAGKRSECEATVALLERALTATQSALPAAKVALLNAEASALKLQQLYFSQASREHVEEFIESGRAKLLRILQLVHAEIMTGRHRPYSDIENLSAWRASLDTLFETVLSDAAERFAKSDQAFATVLGTVGKGDPPIEKLHSQAITSAERGRVRDGGAANDAAIFAAVNQVDSAPGPVPVTREELMNGQNLLVGHQHELHRLESAAESLKKDLATPMTSHERAAHMAKIEEAERKVAEKRAMVNGWAQRLRDRVRAN